MRDGGHGVETGIFVGVGGTVESLGLMNCVAAFVLCGWYGPSTIGHVSLSCFASSV